MAETEETPVGRNNISRGCRQQSSLRARGIHKDWKSSVLVLIGYTVGLGNFWKFPALCHKYNGATFLIPYFVALLCIGIPLFFMELALGQFVSLAPTRLFTMMSPIFSGVGYGLMFIPVLVSLYYNVVIAWAIFYMGVLASCDPVPWANCSIPDCSSTDVKELIKTSEYYYNHSVLGLPTESGNDNVLQVWMVVSLAVAWLLVGICLAGGIRNTAKVLYLTVIFPYIMLAFILARTFDVHQNDTNANFFTVNTTHLLEPDIWKDAAIQVTYSLSVVLGGISTIASYNTLHQNILRDTFLVCLIDTATSVFSGYAVFTVTKSLTYDLNEYYGDEAAIFTVVPVVLIRMDTKSLWALLFFFMIFTLGFDTQLLMMETLTTALFDEFRILRNHYISNSAGFCFVMFLLGIPMTTSRGKEIFDMLNANSSTHSFILVALLEVIIASYVYGFDNMMKILKKDLQLWVPRPLEFYWSITWRFLTPISLSVILVHLLYAHDWSTLHDPKPLDIIGLVISFSVFIILPLRAIYIFFSTLSSEGFQLENWPKLWRARPEFAPEYIREGRGTENGQINGGFELGSM